jgi:hypothetical protein
MSHAGRAFVLRTGAQRAPVVVHAARSLRVGAPVRRSGGDPWTPWPSGPLEHGDKEGETDTEGVFDPDAPLHSVEGVAGVETPAGGGAGGGALFGEEMLRALDEAA